MNAREGVQVRVVTDKDQYFLTNSKAYVLEDDYIPVELPLGVMHDKFVIIDDTILLSGTSGKFFTNQSNAPFLSSPLHGRHQSTC